MGQPSSLQYNTGMSLQFAKPSMGLRESYAAARAVFSGQLSQGPKVEALERRFRAISGASACVAVNSGTSALHIGLLALGIGPGHEVIVPAVSFAATANAVALVGATPVFADIDLSTFNIDPSDVETKITEKTRAIMPVHLFGNPADIDTLNLVSEKFDVPLFFDAAQAHGSKFRNEPVGKYGVASAFSLYATKNISSGEGGILGLNIDGAEEVARELRNQGMSYRYVYERVGLNNRMSDVTAAIGLEQAKRLEGFNSKRRKNAALYAESLPTNLQLQSVREDAQSSWHQFTFLTEDRDRLASFLADSGIPTRIFYPAPLNRLPHFESGDLPNADLYTQNCLSLPVGPHVKKSDIRYICSEVRRFYEVKR